MKRRLFATYWGFLLAMAETKFRESTLTGCLQGKPSLRYHARSEEHFYLQCVDHRSNRSYNQVKWFRQQENKKLLELDNSSEDASTLWFSPARISDTGTYFCSAWEENVCVKIVLEVQAKNDANCSDYGSSQIDFVIGKGGNISCPAVGCDNGLQRSAVPVIWYKDKKSLNSSPSERVVIIDNRIIFTKIYHPDAGIYACDYVQCDNTSRCDINRSWIKRAIINVRTIVENTKRAPIILDPPGDKTLEVELGKPLQITCKVQFGFESNLFPQIKWLRSNRESKNGQLEQKTSKLNQQNELYGITYLQVAKLNKVTDEDIRDIFTCHAQNSIGNSTAVLRLQEKKTDRVYFIYILSITVALLLTVFGGSGFVYIYWIEIVLLCQSYLSKDETQGDKKEFDAFVSYAKQGSFDSNDKEEESSYEEERFAVEYLPEVLEKIYGYKLCLLERDILPGGAYIDDIVTYIKKSRRAIFILSPRYINGPSIFELETAINCTIEDNKLKLILIKYKTFQEPASLLPIIKKALTVLPMVTWKAKAVTAISPTSKFWNIIRYHMPVKKTKIQKERSKILI